MGSLTWPHLQPQRWSPPAPPKPVGETGVGVGGWVVVVKAELGRFTAQDLVVVGRRSIAQI